MTAAAWACIVVGLILAGCAAIARSILRRPRHDRPARPLTRRERAEWRHITRAFARDAELDELRARIAQFGQDGSEDAR